MSTFDLYLITVLIWFAGKIFAGRTHSSMNQKNNKELLKQGFKVLCDLAN